MSESPQNLVNVVPDTLSTPFKTSATATNELITKAQFKAAVPGIAGSQFDKIFDPLNKTLAGYSINTPLDIAAFIATCGHESGNFTVFSENLNYSADALQKVFKKYFPNAAVAASYARKPVAIANRVYANRMGNGPESSGDGWKHRGGGAIQLTGRKNIGAFAFAKNITIEQATDYIRTPAGALDSAGWFWKVNNLSKYGDQGLFQAVQGLVNVGRANATIAQINHWNDRLQRYNRAKKALGV